MTELIRRARERAKLLVSGELYCHPRESGFRDVKYRPVFDTESATIIGALCDELEKARGQIEDINRQAMERD